jgi:hypothetical protein
MKLQNKSITQLGRGDKPRPYFWRIDMSFHKFTLISGTKADGSYKGLIPTGHWNLNAALQAARRSKIVGQINIAHCVSDMSGGGRGGHDGRWHGDESGFMQSEKWREGLKVATP